jgi:UDP:flavonoid glycosyltransferase YjiC (YdhE family)
MSVLTMARPTILFVADGVTLAHLARPAALARYLSASHFEVVLACDPRHSALLGELDCPTLPIRSLSSKQFLQAAARGQPLYDTQTLREYVRDDLALLQRVKPVVVIGDHRLSLSVSARVSGVPYLNIINAYWSPHVARRALPVPDLPMTRWLGVALAQSLFSLAWPIASAWHCAPINRVRREYGQPSLGHDWFNAYTDGDYTLYADAPELVPVVDLPPHHAFLGPIAWSPAVPLPSWWNALPTDRPVVYATMGSSGDPAILGLIMVALADLPISVVVTTAGQPGLASAPANAHQVDYAPGDQMAARAELVICNGGSLTVYQSLTAGKPLIGVASHMDQLLSMAQVERAGVGILMRADKFNPTALREAVLRVLADHAMQARASTMRSTLATYDPGRTLIGILDRVLCNE